MKKQDRDIYTYVANQFGFSETLRILLYEILIPRIEDIGIKVYEPFRTCGPYIEWGKINATESHDEKVRLWKEFNKKVGPINKELMSKSNMMSPILDGGHTVDEGVAGEIGHYSAMRYGPIIALRTDFRLSENIGAIVNPQIESDIFDSNGKICTSLDEWFDSIREVYRTLKGI